MGTTKVEIFTQNENDLASFAKALGHPARIRILEFLSKSNTCYCGEIVDEIGLAQSTVSQHLKELRKAEIIRGDVEGASICYCINEGKWTESKEKLEELFNFVSAQCC